ncbi:MAG: hypothetical protein LQ339_002191 [Xanthoria mediterranea]|nr:MAG: hypothetical protein LQ339_002191 [Xanthoria mediterranea]
MLLLHPLRPHLTLGLGLGLGLGLTATTLHLHLIQRRRPLLCEPASSSPLDAITQQYLPQARKHGHNNNKSTTTANIIRQLSLGSVLGVAAGAAVSTFSRVLAVLLGLGVVVVQYAASYGYNIIPVGRIQRYVKGIDLNRAVEENPAFKLSFGVTFALASMAKF